MIVLTPFIVRNNQDMPRVRKLLQRLDAVQLQYEKLIEDKLEERKEELEQEQHKDIPGQSRTSDDPMSIISPKG